MVRILLDIGASVDILYWNTFLNLHFGKSDLAPGRVLKRGFRQTEIPVAGTIIIPITLEEHAQTTMVNVKFTVVHLMSGYNAILGRVALHDFQVVTSSFHQCLNFPTIANVCVVKGSRQRVCECYMNSTEEMLVAIEERMGVPHKALGEEYPHPELALDMMEIPLGQGTIQVGGKK